MKTETIIEEVMFKASPHDVYEALMDQKKHAKFTDAKAKISREIGGKFEVYDGSINGKNLELVPDKKIIQEWYCASDEWPKGHYSVITILLKRNKDGTILEFEQIGIPEAAYKDIKEGWTTYYWEPMKKMLEK